MAYVKGSNSSESLYGTTTNDLIEGLAGNDTLYGYAGNDTLSGGDGNDVLYGGAGNDYVWGDVGNDILYGGLGADFLGGDDGDDIIRIYRNEGYDTINGGSGNDILECSPSSYTGSSYTVQIGYLSSNETEIIRNASSTAKLNFEVSGFFNISGASMQDSGGGFGSISGGSGADNIYASYLNDTIMGNGGDDNLSGGLGNDTLYGGSGADKFVFYANDGNDLIQDFADGIDLMRIWVPGVVSSFADVTVSANGNGTQLDFAGTTVLLNNVDPGLIDAADFVFT